MSGMKFDDGKLDYSLVDEDAEAEMVAVLTFGATKYSCRGECTCSVLNAESEPSRSSSAGYAGLATRSGSRVGTRHMRNAKGKTVGSGVRDTQTSVNTNGATRRSDQGSKRQSGTEYREKKSNVFSGVAAGYVAESTASASTTNIRQEGFEEDFASRATSASDGLRTWLGSKEHALTCPASRWVSGAGNWASVEDAKDRYFSAARRHLRASRKGEVLDLETGLATLASAACCIHFLLALELRAHPELAASLQARLDRSLAVARALRSMREGDNTLLDAIEAMPEPTIAKLMREDRDPEG